MRYNYPRCNRDFHDRFGWFVSWAIVGHARYAIDVRPPFPSTVHSILIPRHLFLNHIPLTLYNTRNTAQRPFASNYYSSALSVNEYPLCLIQLKKK